MLYGQRTKQRGIGARAMVNQERISVRGQVSWTFRLAECGRAEHSAASCRGPMHHYTVRMHFPADFEREVTVCSTHAEAFVRDAIAKGVLV